VKKAPTAKGAPSDSREVRRRAASAADYFGKKMMLAAGGQGKDSRSPSIVVEKNGVGSQVMKTSTSTIPVNCEVPDYAIFLLALSPISLALQRGWQASEQDTNVNVIQQAYNAWCYLVQTFFTTMRGTYPSMQSAPRWFWEVNAALLPATTNFKTGSIAYKWKLNDGGAVPPPKFPINDVFYFFGSPTGNFTNGFPELVLVSAYDPQQGADAIASLFKFMNDKDMAKVISKPDLTTMENDVSSFASVYAEWGQAAGNACGMALSLLNEVKIRCPIMSKFALYQGQETWRGFQEIRKGTGTPSYVIPRVLEFKSEREFYNKAPPVFKAYNFDEYFLTLSYILALASERIATDQSVSAVPICPLTSQQVQLCLRQSVISRFYNAYAQDLVISYVFGNLGALYPFIVGPNGNAISNVQAMKLPFVFLENVRSATRRTIDVGKKGASYVIDAVPLLVRPISTPQLGNFTYQGREGVASLYVEQPEEIPIDLIDLSFSNHNGFISVTGTALARLIEAWNEYITGLGNALSTLGTVGDEPGISALISTFNTRHITYNSGPGISVPQAGSKTVPRQPSVKQLRKGNTIPERKKVNAPVPVGTSTSYQLYTPIQLTSSDPFYSSLQRYQSAFVQPCTLADSRQIFDQTVAFQQVMQIEPYTIPYTDAQVGEGSQDLQVTIDQLAYASALLDIKSNLSAPSEAEIELTAMAQTGRGGFFTSLAGAIGQGIGIPGAREIAETVGAITGL